MNRINEVNKVNIKNKPLIQSFSGSGAIGTILSAFLIRSFDMELAAIIHSRSVPPVAVIKNGIIEHPIRIFQSDKLALMACEIPIPYKDTPEFLKMLVKYYLKKGVSHIVPVGGLPVSNDLKDSKCYGITPNIITLDFLKEKKVEPLKEGIVYGTIVETLEISETLGFDSAFALLAECDPGTASYEAAKKIILELAKIFDFEFNQEQFTEVTKMIKNRIEESTRLLREESMDKTRESHL